jgi:hypothetical protein
MRSVRKSTQPSAMPRNEVTMAKKLNICDTEMKQLKGNRSGSGSSGDASNQVNKKSGCFSQFGCFFLSDDHPYWVCGLQVGYKTLMLGF